MNLNRTDKQHPTLPTFHHTSRPAPKPVTLRAQGDGLPPVDVSHDCVPQSLPPVDQIRNTNIDRHHRHWQADAPGLRLADLRPGMVVTSDDGFSCIPCNYDLVVRMDSSPNKSLFVTCGHGRHYLIPDADGCVDGFTICTAIAGRAA